MNLQLSATCFRFESHLKVELMSVYKYMYCNAVKDDILFALKKLKQVAESCKFIKYLIKRLC